MNRFAPAARLLFHGALGLSAAAVFAGLMAWDWTGPCAAAVATAAAACLAGRFRNDDREPPDAAALFLAAACVSSWVAGLAWMGGSWAHAFAWAAAAWALGAALARPGLLTRGARALAAGAGGLAALSFWRFLGLNSGEAWRLIEPLGGWRDALFLCGQMSAALAAWFWILASGPAASPRAALAPVLLGLAAGTALTEFSGALLAAVAANAGLFALGAWRLRAQWSGNGLKRGALAALCAACAAFAALDLSLFSDVWLNRLNAAYPGGEYLSFTQSRGEALAVYRFSTRLTALVRNGCAEAAEPLAARRLAHLPLLLARARGVPERLLLIEPLHPATLVAAAAHFPQFDWLERRRVDPALRALSADSAWQPPRAARRLRRGLRAHLWRGGAYDAVILDLRASCGSGQPAARLGTASLKRLRSALKAGGLLAARLPPDWEARRGELSAAARAAFPHAGILVTPGLTLLAASDSPLDGSGAELLARMTHAVRQDDPDLPADTARFAWYNIAK